MVCMGPATRGGCGAKCVQAGVPCRGCYGLPAERARPGREDGVGDRRRHRLERSGGDRRASSTAIPDLIGTFYRFSLPQLDAPPEAASEPMKSITIDPITRLEGHGKIHLFVNDDGNLANCLLPGAGAARLRGLLPGPAGRGDGRGSRPGSAASVPRRTTWPRSRRPTRSTASRRRRRRSSCASCSTTASTPETTRRTSTRWAGRTSSSARMRPRRERNILGVVAKVGLELGAEVIRQRARGPAGRPDHRRQGAPPGDRPARRHVQARDEGGAAGADPDRRGDGRVRQDDDQGLRGHRPQEQGLRRPDPVRHVLPPDLLDRPGGRRTAR